MIKTGFHKNSFGVGTNWSKTKNPQAIEGRTTAKRMEWTHLPLCVN